jgi:hypothetical protein
LKLTTEKAQHEQAAPDGSSNVAITMKKAVLYAAVLLEEDLFTSRGAQCSELNLLAYMLPCDTWASWIWLMDKAAMPHHAAQNALQTAAVSVAFDLGLRSVLAMHRQLTRRR